MTNYSDQTIAEALDSIRRRRYVLPAIQREFVWDTDQICKLFDSVMRGYPISSLLYWQVDAERSQDYRWYDFVLNYHALDAPGCPPHAGLPQEDRVAVLDGQQRLTAFNIGLRGSHAAKGRYMRRDRAGSYLRKHLYLDIAAEPQLSDDRHEDLIYQFKFLQQEEAEAANSSGGAHWYLVADVLGLPSGPESGPAINAYLLEAELSAHPSAFQTLFSLWKAVVDDHHLSFFTERAQDLDRVLDIFIRSNSQGEPLSKSDLLMSIATAQWTVLDARHEISETVRQINGVGLGFDFTRDNVLKAGLVNSGISDVGFRASTFNRENMQRLEDDWPAIAETLFRACELLSAFGLSSGSIDARMVLIPVSYYLHHRGLGDSYLTSGAENEDRERIRDWVVRALLMPGVFGSGLDTLLSRLRRAIDEHGSNQFPSAAIEDQMAAMGKSLRFEPQTIEDLLDTQYQQADVFALLSILYPTVDPAHVLHIDHVFPRAKLRRDALRRAGVTDEELLDQISRRRVNGLANLQLLEGPVNISKSERLPLDWAQARWHNPARLRGYLESNDMEDLPAGLEGFVTFYNARRERMRDRLVAVLGREPGSLVIDPSENPSVPTTD